MMAVTRVPRFRINGKFAPIEKWPDEINLLIPVANPSTWERDRGILAAEQAEVIRWLEEHGTGKYRLTQNSKGMNFTFEHRSTAAMMKLRWYV